MIPDELKTARFALGLSAEAFARLVGAGSGRTVRRWEAGERDIPDHVAIIIDLMEKVPGAKAYLLGRATAEQRS